MSDIFANPTSPLQRRDIRSASKPFKRDRDHDQKWSHGTRPLPGVRLNFSINHDAGRVDGAVDGQHEKLRPAKQHSQIQKCYANRPAKSPSTTNASHSLSISSRITRKADTSIEPTSPEHLSNSLLDLIPVHQNNMNTPIRLASSDGDEEVLYSFEKRPSPNARGREVGLGGLIEQAEKKWESERTEQIIKEYEVLNLEGEAVKGGKKKGSRSPKKGAIKNEVVVPKVEDDDGFELI